MRTIAKIRRSVRAISPVISVLLMIAIAVSSSLVAYAWVMGYFGFTTAKVGKALQIQSYAIGDSGNLIVYVQNVGVGQVQLKQDGAVYLDDNLVGILMPGDPLIAIDEGKTVSLVLNYQYYGEWIKIRVVTAGGTFSETSGQPKSSGTSAGQYSVNFAFDAGGQSVSPSGSYSYGAGARVAISATPLANYVFDQWRVTGLVSVDDPGADSTFAKINGAGTVKATFMLSSVMRTITASAGANGRIDPSGGVTVNEHADKTFDISADSGYHVADVLVDGVSVGAQVTYTFIDVTADHTISASFAANPPATHTISASASANGIIDPSGAVIVHDHNDQRFTITPGTGYHVVDVLVDGGSVGALASYTFSDVTSDHAIVANFAIDTFVVTVVPGPNGLMKLNGNVVSGGVTFNDGETPTFSIVPNSGYQVADVRVDMVSKGKILQYQFSPIHAAHSISASFEQIPDNFAIVVLPDTQFYSANINGVGVQIFNNQTQWTVNSVDGMNIVFVTHLGDIVDSYGSVTQWQNAYQSLSRFEGQVPWAVLPGNHDGLNVGSAGEDLSNYISYFGTANSFQLFSAGFDDYLIFNFQYNADNNVLAWANSVLAQYPNRRVIVSTHSYLDVDGSRTAIGDRLWQNFVGPHADQVFLVLCGHMHGEARRSDVVNGHTVYQILSDYQSRANGGDGWLRILSFHPTEDKIYVNTFSPYLNSYESDSSSEFAIDYDMTSAKP